LLLIIQNHFIAGGFPGGCGNLHSWFSAKNQGAQSPFILFVKCNCAVKLQIPGSIYITQKQEIVTSFTLSPAAPARRNYNQQQTTLNNTAARNEKPWGSKRHGLCKCVKQVAKDCRQVRN
jgi:hypothetical protein